MACHMPQPSMPPATISRGLSSRTCRPPLSHQRPRPTGKHLGLRRPKLRAVSQGKGFGKPQSAAPPKQTKKVSERGTISSRPGPDAMTKAATAQAEKERAAANEARLAYEEERRKAAAESVPQVVTDRMLGRIIAFTGVPMLIGFISFPTFYYLKVLADPPVDVPTWFAYGASLFAFGGAALGITYGVLSASWDPSRKGSALGLTEFQANLPVLIANLPWNKNKQ